MKLLILKNNIVEGLGILERAIGTATNLPILKNILIKCFENKILFVATDLEIAIQKIIPGKILEEGEYTIPFSILNTVVKNINAERITFEEKNKKLFITTDNYEATIQGQEAKEYPIIPSLYNTKQFCILPVVLFRQALTNVIVAAHYSEIRPEISGVYMKFSGTTLVLVATDSFRLAEYTMESKEIQSTLELLQVIIPLKTAEELLRILHATKEETIKIFLDPNQILFKTNTDEIISRLIDGTFPEYQAIIPKNLQTEVTIDRQEFTQAIRLISSFSGRTNDVVITSGENKKFLELYAGDAAVGENVYRVPVKIHGNTFKIAFNWKYVLDGLKIYSGNEIMLGINGSDRPAMITNRKEPSLLYILMPIKS